MYTIYYKVIGDENHKDSDTAFVPACINPLALTIGDMHFTYNRSNTFTRELNGVKVDGEANNRTVIAAITTGSSDAGTYTYSDSEAIAGNQYTIAPLNSNYIIANLGTLTIDPIPVVLKWKEPLTFISDNTEHKVEATVANNLEGDNVSVTRYTDNTGVSAGSYTAQVIELDNTNYTLLESAGAQNVTRPWRIFNGSNKINLTVEPASIIYESRLTLRLSPIGDVTPLLPSNVSFYVNNEKLNTTNDAGDDGSVTTSVFVTAKNKFFIGANVIRAEYNAQDGSETEIDAVTVNPKPIFAEITGETNQTYDGNKFAVGLKIQLEDSSLIETGDTVEVTAESFTYESSDVGEHTVAAQNVIVTGENSGNYDPYGNRNQAFHFLWFAVMC